MIEFNTCCPMRSGNPEQEMVFNVHQKDSKTFLYPNCDNAADHIWVHDSNDQQGISGRVVNFKLFDGQTLSLQGPWHTNPNYLLRNGGPDLREKHRVRYVIALDRETNKVYGNPDKYWQILEAAPETGIICAFDYVSKKAQNLADERGQRVFYAQVTEGGSMTGSANPGGSYGT